MSTWRVDHGDCLDLLRAMPDCSVDSVCCDPPYGLSFMGKKWDYDVPSVEVWAECLRVLKPGGHLLAFAGTRTQHRMAVRIEDAGFEIRDMIAWVYGSGFPKSLDVGKAIDKMDAGKEQERRRFRFTAWVCSTKVTAKQINKATGTEMGNHYTTHPTQPAIMTREHLEQCRHLLGDVPEWVEREADIRSVESRNFAAREVVGEKSGLDGSGFGNVGHGLRSTTINITAPATPAARQWQGWGTALKPALEPITMARKPFPGTVAANVLQHGTGAVNVDGCRVGWPGGAVPKIGTPAWGGPAKKLTAVPGQHGDTVERAEPHAAGRWPSNLIHDGSDEVLAGFPETKSGKMMPTRTTAGVDGRNAYGADAAGGFTTMETYGDSGSAARFFYCPKASKADREAGLDGMPSIHRPNGNKWTDQDYRVSSGERPPSAESGPRSNPHPTVKPTALMQYLCRLVTPPGGTVLDPFTGSGSTGKAAMLEGFNFIGFEREAEYVEIARRRIAEAANVLGGPVCVA